MILLPTGCHYLSHQRIIMGNLIKCADCGIEGIHACVGKPVNKEDLPEGVVLFESGEITKRMIKELNKHDISKSSG